MYVKDLRMIHGPIILPPVIKADFYTVVFMASWGMHAMPYLFILFFGGGKERR